MKKWYTTSAFEAETGWKFGRMSWSAPTVTSIRFGATPLKADMVERYVIRGICILGSPKRFYIRWARDGVWFDGPFTAGGLDEMIEFANQYILAECPAIRAYC